MAIAWGSVVALALPVVFVVVGYQAEVVRLETTLQVGARTAATSVQKGRGAADLDERSARQLLSALAGPGAFATVRIVDAEGTTLAVADGDSRGPLVQRSAELFPGRSGGPRVEMSQSLRPLVLHALVMLAPGLLLGLAAAVGLTTVPMRAFRQALQEAEVRREAEERLAKSLSVFAATLESTADGILVTDVLGRAVVCNERFLQLWNLPGGGEAGAVDPGAMFAIANHLRDPVAFLEIQQNLERRIDVDHGAVLELLDGRIFEWSSRPQCIGGEVVGRVASFRDISERRRAEALLSAEKEVLEMVVCGAPLTAALGLLARRLEVLSGEMFCGIVFRESHEEDSLSLAVGSNLPPHFAETLLREGSSTLEGIFHDVSALQDGHAAPAGQRDGILIDEVRGRPAWDAYRARLTGLDVEVGCSVSVRSAAGNLMGIVVAHYRPGTDLPRNDWDLIRVASHLTRIAIERRHAEAQLRFLAHYDALTLLPNRDLFRDRLSQALSQAARRGDCVAVMFIDLDRFKNINDTLGHDAGDLLLCRVSERLRGCVRDEDTVARLGGDEFTVILPQVRRPDDAGLVASQIIDALSEPILLNGRETFATPSIGITVYPADGTTVESLLRNADTAMYRAKKDGGNGYCFFDPAMNLVAEDRLELESGLRRALERGEFVVHYQPKLDLDTGRIGGAEALLRWRHPERGLVSPAEFVPILEETGLIEAVGEWVLREVCAQIRDWRNDGLPPLAIAVNLSARQLQHNDVAATIERIVSATGIDPGLLEVEVTESMLMRDPALAADTLDRIREKGVRHISVDDFGTGYSSLSYLKRFPIDTLKLDRSFVEGLPHDQDDVAISLAVLALGHSLKMKIVAEGVETEEQRAFLEAEGCDVLQGYLVSGAVSADALARMMRAQAAQGTVRHLPGAAREGSRSGLHATARA